MDANQCDRRSTDDTTRYAAIARASVDRLVDFVNAKNRVQLGNVMGCDGVDKIDYQYEAKDKSFKIKGAYLVSRTKIYSVPCVCRCMHIHSLHSKFSDNAILNRLIHTRIF
jgi:hypothetical protein